MPKKIGRKKLDEDDKAVRLAIYPKKRVVDGCGGEEQSKKIAMEALVNNASSFQHNTKK
jgi:hypothetical protein